MNVRQTITEEIKAVLTEAGKKVPELSDATSLMNGLDMDSLEFAVLVVRLEQRLQVDPFNSAGLQVFPTTIGELIELYLKSVGSPNS